MRNDLVNIACYFCSWSLDETCTGTANAGTESERFSALEVTFPPSSPLCPSLPSKCSVFAVSALIGLDKTLNHFCPIFFNLAACSVPNWI